MEGDDRRLSLLDRFRQKKPPPAELDLLLVSRLCGGDHDGGEAPTTR